MQRQKSIQFIPKRILVIFDRKWVGKYMKIGGEQFHEKNLINILKPS